MKMLMDQRKKPMMLKNLIQHLKLNLYQKHKKRNELKWKKQLDGGINTMHQKQN
jgi:hypothetical protein